MSFILLNLGAFFGKILTKEIPYKQNLNKFFVIVCKYRIDDVLSIAAVETRTVAETCTGKMTYDFMTPSKVGIPSSFKLDGRERFHLAIALPNR